MSTTTITPSAGYGTAKWIVSATLGQGTHTTITAALTSASSGDTIFVRSGTYTENLTLKAGVNITAFQDGDTPNVSIVGKLSMTTAGSATISGVRLSTNSDYFLAVTGSAASKVYIDSCYLNMSNFSGINYTSSSASSLVYVTNCFGDSGTTGVTPFVSTGAGFLVLEEVQLSNTGASTTTSTSSAGTLVIRFSGIPYAITTSSTAAFAGQNSIFGQGSLNTTALTIGGSGGSEIYNSEVQSGTASAISVSVGTIFVATSSSINSLNTNAITGAGTINYAGLSFPNSSNINTTSAIVINSGPSSSFGATNSGGTNTLKCFNGSNTASSSSTILSSVAGSTADDPIFQSIVSGVTTWSWGIDNSITSPTADPFVIAQGTALGTNNIMSVATSGEINYPLQPSFLARNSVSDTNQTGDGTVYTIICDTVIFDQNSDYNNSTGTLTAPVTGRYFLDAEVTTIGIGASNTNNNTISLVTSNRTYNLNLGNATAIKDLTNNALSTRISSLADMDAADTCTVTVTYSGGTKTVGVLGSGTMDTSFSGCLLQ